MEYDIIEQMAELAVSGLGLEDKLSRVCKLALDCSGFDQCCIYLWSDKRKLFILKASAGEKTAVPECYCAEEGLPGFIMRCNLTDAYEAGSAQAPGVMEDKGFEGYDTALAYPLRGPGSFHGVMYLKSRHKAHAGQDARRVLKIAALETSAIIMRADLIRDNEKMRGEMLQMSTRLANAEKLMILGDMAATMAHDIRNPLISIGGFAKRLQKRLAPESWEMPYVKQMLNEVSRVEKLLNSMVRFTKDSAVDLRLEDVNSMVEESLSLFAGDMAGINLVREYAGGRLPVMADREQLKIAFDNIIANAIQSVRKSSKGGVIKVSTGLDEARVYARVADNGGGIDPKLLANIFNPFFTTKKHGTGLGLSITKSIVLRHEGVIEIDNEAGVGVAFTVKLPSAPNPNEV